MRRRRLRLALVASTCAALFFAPAAGSAGAQRADSTFAGLVARLSEPGGYFDSDNIITNEASYLHVASQLAKVGVRGGVYIGVGPDQNFSYVALIRPSIALMTDIRRDNLLEHLLFKSLFAVARNRLEYLCLLLGKPVPADVAEWTGRPTSELLAYLARTKTDSATAAATRASSNARIAAFGVPLDDRDRAMIDRYRAEFVASGLETRYSSLGRNNRMSYPSFGELIAATDREGRQVGYLGSETAFQYVRDLQLHDRIIPVIANVAGTRAMAAIARLARERGLTISAFYLPNVEQYLIERDEGFAQYVANVRPLPRTTSSVIIRSYFRRLGTHPLFVPAPGNVSTSMVETIDSFLHRFDTGEIRSYGDLVFSGYVTP